MSSLSPAERQRMREAIGALPEPIRTIYLAHLVEGLDYRAIAEREGLNVRDVERHIAEAIVLIDCHIRASGDL